MLKGHFARIDTRMFSKIVILFLLTTYLLQPLKSKEAQLRLVLGLALGLYRLGAAITHRCSILMNSGQEQKAVGEVRKVNVSLFG